MYISKYFTLFYFKLSVYFNNYYLSSFLFTDGILEKNPFSINSTELDTTPPLPSTPIPANMFNEYNSTLTFSSTRTPKSVHRKTMFDISMEIIEQRIQNINRTVSARKNRSMSESDLIENIDIDETLNVSQSTPHLEKGKSLLAIDQFNGPSATLAEQAAGNSISAGSLPNVAKLDEPKPLTAVKKRKLFAPPSLYTNFNHIEEETLLAGKSNKTPIAKTDKKTAITPKNISQSKKRFREPSNNNDEDNGIVVGAKKKVKICNDSQMPNLISGNNFNNNKATSSSRRTTFDFKPSIKTTQVPIATQQLVKSTKPQVLPSLVYTNMHKPQIDVIQQVGKI